MNKFACHGERSASAENSSNDYVSVYLSCNLAVVLTAGPDPGAETDDIEWRHVTLCAADRSGPSIHNELC